MVNQKHYGEKIINNDYKHNTNDKINCNNHYTKKNNKTENNKIPVNLYEKGDSSKVQ